MVTLKSDKNRGYLIAGIGAFVALFAFLYLPFISVSSTGSSATFPMTTTLAAHYQGGIWLEGILALAILVLTCLLLFRTNPFGSSSTPVVNQIRGGIYGLGGGAILCILAQYFIFLSVGSSFQTSNGGTSSTVSTNYDFGSWLYLLGMIAVIVGTVIAYQKSGFVASTPGASSYNAQAPSMPYAVPGSSPYDSSYPSSAPQGSIPPYQQNVQPSSPYDAQRMSAPSYPQNAGQSPYPYQEQNPQPPQYQVPNQQPPQGPPQQWPPSYPSQ